MAERPKSQHCYALAADLERVEFAIRGMRQEYRFHPDSAGQLEQIQSDLGRAVWALLAIGDREQPTQAD
ncbi:MAG: hypothetical protein AB7U18_00260 [Dehalococcoidia bacterium]